MIVKTRIQLTAKFCVLLTHVLKRKIDFIRIFMSILVLSSSHYFSFLFTVLLHPVSSLVSLNTCIVLPTFFFLESLKYIVTFPFISYFRIPLNCLLPSSQLPKALHYIIGLNLLSFLFIFLYLTFIILSCTAHTLVCYFLPPALVFLSLRVIR